MSDTKLINDNHDLAIDDHDIIIDDLDLSHDYGEKQSGETEKPQAPSKSKDDKEETVVISKSKLVLIKKIMENIKTSNEQLNKLLASTIDADDEERISIAQVSDNSFNLNSENNSKNDDGRIIEGVFDGESMIGPDGKQYSVPANYASKSKLIEGDALKLTITSKGTFVYKQIKPIERRRIIGVLNQESSGNYVVVAENNKWHVLTASVTYYKGQIGDEVVIIVPMNDKSKWAAVDNIVKNAVL